MTRKDINKVMTTLRETKQFEQFKTDCRNKDVKMSVVLEDIFSKLGLFSYADILKSKPDGIKTGYYIVQLVFGGVK